MSRDLDAEDVARRGAPYPYADPLPEDARRAHATVFQRAMAWCAAIALISALVAGTGAVVLAVGVDGVFGPQPTWTAGVFAAVVLAVSAPVVSACLRRAQRHQAVLTAYPAAGTSSTRP